MSVCPCYCGQALLFPGYPVTPSTRGDNQEAVTTMTTTRSLKVIRGQATGEQDEEGRLYATTTEKLEVGMSGGPVLDEQGKCVGISQGVFQAQALPGMSKEYQELQCRLDGKAGFIPTAAFLPFLTVNHGGRGAKPVVNQHDNTNE